MTWWYESGDSCYGRGGFGLATSRLLYQLSVVVISYHRIINYQIVISCHLVIYYRVIISYLIEK